MKKLTIEEHYKSFQVTIALKVVLAGIICVVINNLFNLELGYFSLLFQLLILVLAHGNTFKTGLITLIGSLISGFVSLIISYIFLDSSVLYVVSMSVWIFVVVTLLVGNFVPLLISSVTATMIMYNSIYSSVSEATTIFGEYTIQLLLAVAVCFLIDALVWPNRTRGIYILTLSTLCEELSKLFQSYTEEVSKRKDHKDTSVSLLTFSQLVTYANRINREEGDQKLPVEPHLKLIAFCRDIFVKIEVFEEYTLKEHSFMKENKVKEKTDEIFKNISQSFLILAQSIGTEKLVDINYEELKTSIFSLGQMYKTMHEIQGRENQYYEDLLALGSMIPLLEDISYKMKKVADQINLFHSGEYIRVASERVTHAKDVDAERKRSFFVIDQDSVRVGIKTVVIFLLLMFGEAIIGLPGQGQVVFFAILFGVIPNLGQAYMKTRYGILGVFIGLAMSFLALMILAISPRFLIVLTLYSLGTFIAVYMASSSRDISVTGLQAGLLFPFSILYVTGPGVDIDAALTRFLALFSAIFIGLIIQNLLWPSNPYKMLIKGISKSISDSGQILSILLLTQHRDSKELDKYILPIAASLPTSTALLHDAEYVIREDKLHSDDFMDIIENVEKTYAELQTLKNSICDNKDSNLFEGHMNIMKPLYQRLENLYGGISCQFENNQDFFKQLTQLSGNLEAKRSEYRSTGLWKLADPKDVEQLVLFTTSIDNLLNSLGHISQAITNINHPRDDVALAIRTNEA